MCLYIYIYNFTYNLLLFRKGIYYSQRLIPSQFYSLASHYWPDPMLDSLVMVAKTFSNGLNRY